jgi:hypothetical protein
MQMICRNFQMVRIFGLLLDGNQRWTQETKVTKFVCREEKGKAAWAHAVEPGTQWSTESGWKLGFIAFFYCPRVEVSLWHEWMFCGKKCLPG